MDYQRIKCFLKAAETLNFSEAARQLYITPQAFGKQINLLEQEMGFALFERSTRQTRLTSAGKECYENLREPFRVLEKEYDKMVEQGNRKNRLTRVGVFNALSRKKVVSPIVSKLISEFPERDININMYDMGQMQREIQDGKMDLGIMTTHDTEGGWDECEQVVLKEFPSKIVVSTIHKWAAKECITLEDMKEESFIRMMQPQFTPEDYYATIPCKQHLVVENYESMLLGVDQGNCFTIMPYDIDSISEQEYVTFDMPWMPFSFRLVLMYNREHADSYIEELCQFLKNEFETIGL